MLAALARAALRRPGSSPPASVRRSQATGILTGTLGGILVAGLVFLVLDFRYAREERLQRLGDVAAAVAEAARDDGVGGDRVALALRAVPWGEVERVEVYDARRGTNTVYELGELLETTRAQTPPTEGWPTAVRRIPGVDNDGAVAVRSSSYALLQRTVHLTSILIALLACALPAAYLVSRSIYRRFQRQVLDLVQVAEVISSRRDYSIRAIRHGSEEMALLVDTINHMITQVELSDGQLRKEVERAEAASLAKAQFLATMSHEIRTPINGILGMVQLLMDTDLSREQREFASTTLTSAEGLLAIINDILDFSKLEAGQVQLEEIPLSLSDVLKAILEPASIVAFEKGVELCCDVAPDVPDRLRGDAMRLRQVLLNLTGNALKFTTRGAVVVRVSVIAAGAEHTTLSFEVRDSGIGIPPERVESLFQPFVQVDASHSRRYGGTGLGLAICRQIVEAMGGELYVRSEEGRGSTFGFTLELAHAERGDPAPRLPGGLRVLLAEPGRVGRGILTQALQPGNDVLAVADAAEARRALASARSGFDLALLDLAVIEELSASGTDVTCPLVVMTPLQGLAGARRHVRGRRGALLTRPVRRAALLRCMQELGLGAEPALPGREAERAAPAPASQAELPSLHVLVAEDHPVNQRIITRFLEKAGATYELATDGQEAVDAFRRARFDLVLMDIQMPVMDGLAATRAIRALEREEDRRPTRIAAMTANAMPEDRRSAAEAGLDDHLTKPMRWEELRRYLAGVEARAPRGPMDAPPALPQAARPRVRLLDPDGGGRSERAAG